MPIKAQEPWIPKFASDLEPIYVNLEMNLSFNKTVMLFPFANAATSVPFSSELKSYIQVSEAVSGFWVV